MWILWLVLGVAIVVVGIWIVVAVRPAGIRKMRTNEPGHHHPKRGHQHGAAHRRDRRH
jgi:hypothetical protein